MFVLQLVLQEDSCDRRRSEREVEHARTAEDHDQALRGERIERADTQPQQGKSDDFVHRLFPHRTASAAFPKATRATLTRVQATK